MLIALVVLFFSVAFVDGKPCLCQWGSHPQDLFCRADFVVRGRILSGPTEDYIPEVNQSRAFRHWPKHRRVLSHLIEVSQIFKGTDKIGLAGPSVDKRSEGEASVPYKMKIYADMTPCPVWLRGGEDYLITGLVDDAKLFTSSCHWLSPWRHVTQAQKLGIHNVYGDNCRCRVKSCSFLGPGGGLLDSHCSNGHLYCGKHGLSCLWKTVIEGENKHYRKCKASIVHGLNRIRYGRHKYTRLLRRRYQH